VGIVGTEIYMNIPSLMLFWNKCPASYICCTCFPAISNFCALKHNHVEMCVMCVLVT